MSTAFRLFAGLLVIAPAFLFADILLFRGFLTAYAACLLLVISFAVKPGEAAFLNNSIRRYAVGGGVIAALFVLQLLPLPVESWQHPIWLSASTALGHAMWGSISISPGDTVIALGRFLTFGALFAVATAVSIDRQRAEIFLFLLLGLTTLLAVVMAVHNVGGFIFLGEISSVGPRAVLALASSMAAILSLGLLVYAFERYETRHTRADFSQTGFVATLTAAIIGFVIAVLTVVLFMPKAQGIAMLMGIVTFLLIVGFRRAAVAKLGLAIPAATLGIPALLAIAGDHARSMSLRFAADAPAPLADATQRAINDVGWFGSGAGTFANILPLYADAAQSGTVAPTAIAASVIDFGWPLTLLFIALAIVLILRLIHGALTRGRDSFFTAAAASCLVAALIEAFLDASLLHTTSQILIAAVIGLGVAQCVSRTVRQT